MVEDRNTSHQVVVIGAGAAGFLAAYSAAAHGANVVLVDRRKKIGAKILISGGTRCNVTNREVTERDFNTPSRPFVRNVLREFSADQARAFFEQYGVGLKLEPTGKYFPASDSARDVLAGLLRATESVGVQLKREVLVTGVRNVGNGFELDTPEGILRAKAIVVCTGGLSFPQTGSDGIGYAIAQQLGHRIERTSPALTPLLTSDRDLQFLAGVTLPVQLRLFVDGRVDVDLTGSFLFTHQGFSGPVAMNISRHWVRRGWASPRSVEVRASFCPGGTQEQLTAQWLAESRRSPGRRVVNYLGDFIPNRLAEFVVSVAEAGKDLTLAHTSRPTRQRILSTLLEFQLPVSGVVGYAKAEVTAGGIPLDEVVARSMQSRVQPGLFFAGEILDVDGYIGGYNFQWAWSSGWVAGKSAARYSLETGC